MQRLPVILLLVALSAFSLSAQEPEPAAPESLTLEVTPLGDSDEMVVSRLTFRLRLDQSIPPGTPLVIQGSVLQKGAVVRNFRYALLPNQLSVASFVQSLPVGDVEIDARLLIPFESEAPMLLGRVTHPSSVALTGKPYEASAEDGAEGILAEGIVPETTGAIRILPPRRDLAPNLFIVDVETKAPVQRVEFWVDEKKIFTKNAPPYRAELDLGAIPKRVEVKVVGYDRAGRYVDAETFVVNERETPLEVKITRTVTPDGISHFKLNIQNPRNVPLKDIALFAGDRKLIEWERPPYAFSIANAQLAGVEFVRASATDEANYEASDLVFLDGTRFSEQIDVNLVELPVSVVDAAGVAITDLQQGDFRVMEDGKPQKITSFGFSSNLPISVGILVDHSGSMKPRLDGARKAAIAFFEDILTPKDRAFFGAFAWDPSSISPFVSNVQSLRSQVISMPEAEGGTALYDAIVSGLYRFRTVTGSRALIMVSDGEDTVSRLTYDDMLRYVRASRVPIYFIGIGISALDFTVTSRMRNIAAETGGVAYFIRNVDDLSTTYEKLEAELRSQYLIGYYAESTRTDDKYRAVDVQTTRSGARVRTIKGYIP
jgi:Ca-activated chloride channel homolog